MSRPLYCSVFLAVLAGGIAFGQESNQQRRDRLAELLKRFPAADANRDGVLTEGEARAFRDRARSAQRPREADSTRPQPTHADVTYGPRERNTLDLYLVESKTPTPLVIYIHGGGFVGGDKRGVSPKVIRSCHSAGISVAAIHYTFVSESPFPAPQRDAARAVQFLRAHAARWNIDPDRFAAYGGSAGAGLSLWLGFHADLADPDADDPVLRESTRLSAIGSRGGQTTYNPIVIKEWVGGRAYEHPSIFKCYDISKIEEMTRPDLQLLYDEVSAINHLTRDDPPVYMVYNEPNGPLPDNARPGQGIHHPVFAFKLIEKMKPLNIEYVYRHTREFEGDTDLEMVEYFKQWLGVRASGE